MKDGNALIPETIGNPDTPATNVTIEAEYYQDPILETRTNKDWVSAGTWTAPDRLFNFTWHGGLAFNLWFQINQEGYDADPEFRLRFHAGGGSGSVTLSETDPDNNDIIMAYFDVNVGIDRIGKNDTLALEIEYSGYEDCTIYFDNVTYDSGVTLDSDFMRPQSIEAKDNEVVVDICDAFDTDWAEVAGFWDIRL